MFDIHLQLQLTVSSVCVCWTKLSPENVVFTDVLINHIPAGCFSSSLVAPQCSAGPGKTYEINSNYSIKLQLCAAIMFLSTINCNLT